MVVSSLLDNDGLVAPPSSRVGTPPPATLAGPVTRRMREATTTMPDSVQVTLAATTRVAPTTTTRVATGVPETAIPEATRVTPVAAVEMPGGPATGQMGFRRGHRF